MGLGPSLHPFQFFRLFEQGTAVLIADDHQDQGQANQE